MEIRTDLFVKPFEIAVVKKASGTPWIIPEKDIDYSIYALITTKGAHWNNVTGWHYSDMEENLQLLAKMGVNVYLQLSAVSDSRLLTPAEWNSIKRIIKEEVLKLLGELKNE